MKVIGKDRTSCDVCNPIDEILARLDALERRASAIVAKVQGIAPDGEGNVTLPTSSSDTDPLHGRIDAFAMSSEVKEAADDAHAYAASIADDVVVINSEIDALNQAVAALQPAEIEAIKIAVETLQTTVATLESTVATLNNSVEGKVSKSGDTMTGILFLQKTAYPQLILKATDGVLGNNTAIDLGAYETDLGDGIRRSQLRTAKRADDSTQVIIRSYSTDSNGKEITKDITLMNMPDGTAYVTVPSWSVGTNDNSDKILTIKMTNSLPSLVHTTGNETIAGSKVFTSSPSVKTSGKPLELHHTGMDYTSSNSSESFIHFFDKNGVQTARIGVINGTSKAVSINQKWDNVWYDLGIKFDGTKGFGYGPTTPSDATGNEIATADWVISKINELATKNNLMGL